MKNEVRRAEKIFGSLCRKTQPELKKYVAKRLTEIGYKPTVKDGFVYAKGTVPVLLVAHMDTVHGKQCRNIYRVYDKETNKTGLTSPEGIGGDDRCGIYMVFEVIKELKCHVLFTEDEEIGGIGASHFKKANIRPDVNYIIEFDRKGERDAVFYYCDNKDFTDFICDGFYRESWGTFSDISIIAPHLKVAAVNLSCGYYEAHTVRESVIVEEMMKSVEEAKRIIRKKVDKPFEYIEEVDDWDYGYYGGWDDFGGYKVRCRNVNKTYGLEVLYTQGNNKEGLSDYIMCNSEEEGWARFFFENPDVCFNDVLDWQLYEE